MGSVDKGLVLLQGQPMVAHVLDRFAAAGRRSADQCQPQHRRIRSASDTRSSAIASTASPDRSPDCTPGSCTPAHPLLATVPCDSPFLPLDLVARLSQSLEAQHAELAVARTLDQPHPVFALVRRDVLPHLERFLAGGGRKIDAWYATLKTVEVAFDDEADAFRNINTADELAEASR